MGNVGLNLWQSSSVFRPDGGTLANWLLTVAHNRINDRLRQKRRTGEIQNDILDDRAAAEASEGEGDTPPTPEALQRLTDDRREVVLLSYYRGYSQSEISQRLGVSLTTIRTRMRLALGSLRKVSDAR